MMQLAMVHRGLSAVTETRHRLDVRTIMLDQSVLVRSICLAILTVLVSGCSGTSNPFPIQLTDGQRESFAQVRTFHVVAFPEKDGLGRRVWAPIGQRSAEAYAEAVLTGLGFQSVAKAEADMIVQPISYRVTPSGANYSLYRGVPGRWIQTGWSSRGFVRFRTRDRTTAEIRFDSAHAPPKEIPVGAAGLCEPQNEHVRDICGYRLLYLAANLWPDRPLDGILEGQNEIFYRVIGPGLVPMPVDLDYYKRYGYRASDLEKVRNQIALESAAATSAAPH